jgi:hypothetical protein
MCLAKLFNFKNESQSNAELNEYNIQLEKFGLHAFEHRLVLKLATFAHKIINNVSAPVCLKDGLKKKLDVSTTIHLRERLQATATHQIVGINSRHKDSLVSSKATTYTSFSHFFTNFVNNLVVEDIHLGFSFFKTKIINNINLIFIKFFDFFPDFNLKNKNFDYLFKKKIKPISN